MGRKPIRNATFQPFEGESKNGRHVRITFSMMKSQAWKQLKAISVKLYLYLKLKYRGDASIITFTCTYKEVYGELSLCDRSIKAAFDDLINKGFIELEENNRHRMKKNVYRFSENWQIYIPDKNR